MDECIQATASLCAEEDQRPCAFTQWASETLQTQNRNKQQLYIHGHMQGLRAHAQPQRQTRAHTTVDFSVTPARPVLLTEVHNQKCTISCKVSFGSEAPALPVFHGGRSTLYSRAPSRPIVQDISANFSVTPALPVLQN